MKRGIESPIRAAVFDFGGVLLDWNPHYLYLKHFGGDPQAVDAFLREIGFSEWNARQDAGRPFAEAVAELSARFPSYAGLIRAYDEEWMDSLGGPIPDGVDLLRQVKATGIPLYGFSNWSAEKYRLVRSQYAFMDWFTDIIVSGEVGLIKPDPRIFALLLERVGRPAQECLYIDDSPHNLEVAARLGFHGVQFSAQDGSAAAARAELARLGLVGMDGQAA